MNINIKTSIICVFLLLVCCLIINIQIDRFVSNGLNSSIDLGVLPIVSQENPLPVYHQEMTLDDAKVYFDNLITHSLKSELQAYEESKQLLSVTPQDEEFLEFICSQYVMQKLNNKIPSLNFRTFSSSLHEIKKLGPYTVCTINMIIHRESKHYGFGIITKIVLLQRQVIGITDVSFVGMVSEDRIYLEKGYDKEKINDNAFNINHTILKDSRYEYEVLEKQKESLFKDRGIN
jgi:hypothetical protein